MQTWHIKTLLIHAVSFAKPFMVFDCLSIDLSSSTATLPRGDYGQDDCAS